MGSGVYNMTKRGVVGFSDALRQECALAHVRVTAIEPGWVDTELQGHNEHPLVVERMEEMIKSIDKILEPEDIARAITFAVTQPPHVSINEMLIRPTTSGRRAFRLSPPASAATPRPRPCPRG
jgi:NADP-dependent 3-hydroxy acid dehydrogenase YdfG